MADINSWVWYPGTTWPGFSLSDQDNLDGRGNGLSVDPGNYTEVILRDADGNDEIDDHDTDDSQPASYSEGMIIDGVFYDPHEMGVYENSTLVVDGVTYTDRRIEVWVFEDGTYAVRLTDSSIPPTFYHHEVTQITLGTWDGVEYDGAMVSAMDQAFVCFTAGTRIATPEGWRTVEALVPGDMVLTLDAGAQPVLWCARRRSAGQGRQAPLRIEPGVLGNHRAVCLSPQHRLLLGGPLVRQSFGAAGVLAPVRHLEAAAGIAPCPGAVHYHHFLLPSHQVVLADGLLAESMYPGPEALSGLSGPQLGALLCRVPALRRGAEGYGPLARPVPRGRLIREIATRDLRPQEALRDFPRPPGLDAMPGSGDMGTNPFLSPGPFT